MARPPKFSRDAMLAGALQVVAREGPRGSTIGQIAEEVGAPSGSIYHRFASRDVLLAELWLETVENFQRGFLAALEGPDTLERGVAAALYTPQWARERLPEARLLLVHRREDLLATGGGWPGELTERARRLGDDLVAGVRAYARRHFGEATAERRRRVSFAVIEIPGGAVRHHLVAGRPPPRAVDGLVEEASRAVLAP
jgi:AcrR family transcriptional regulator